ncbi:translocation/assembly module TamB domain-containing protein [Balneola sp. MJW-20]|uniref:translocation/assembly module TamB domain-containing protein n=1 Tax=Gracilimonas aurantiaca TaxID=3234185 RepID=UPI0034671461
MLRFLKPVLYGFGVLILLAGLLRISLFSSPVLNFAKNKALTLINDQLNAELSVGNLEGDLWKELTLTNITLENEGVNVAGIDTVVVAYDIYSLLSDIFEISELKITAPQLDLIQSEGKLNASDWVKESEEEETETGGNRFKFRIADVMLHRGSLDFTAPEILPDSGIAIADLHLGGSIALLEEPMITIREFSASVIEGRLPEPIEIAFSGDYQGKKVTMNELVVNSGRSLLQSSGSYGLDDDEIDLDSEARPLSLGDINAYLEETLPAGQIRMELKLGGSLSRLTAGLNLKGPGIEALRLRTVMNVKDTLILNEAGIKTGLLDLNTITNNQLNAEIDSIDIELTGSLPLEWLQSDFKLKSRVEGIRYENYYIDMLDLEGSYKERSVAVELNLVLPGNGSLKLEPVVIDLDKEDPGWDLNYLAENIDLSSVLNIPEFRSMLSFEGNIRGRGFEPGKDAWVYELRSLKKPDKDRPEYFVGPQSFRTLDLRGELDQDTVTASMDLTLDKSTADISLKLGDYLGELPGWNYEIKGKAFDLSEVVSLDSLPTSLNFYSFGNGSGFEVGNVDLIGGLKIDSSEINGASVDLLQCGLSIESGVLQLPNGVIRSEIVDGDFEGRKNLINNIDVQNRLTANFNLKNIQPFAALAGVERLQALGELKAEVSENNDGILELTGDLDLNSVEYGDLFQSESLTGDASVRLTLPYEYDFDLDLISPEISGIPFQDLNFRADGTYEELQTLADFGLTINSEEGSIEQEGNLVIETGIGTEAEVQWSVFDIKSKDRVFKLQDPFRLNYEQGVIRSDSLKLASEDGSYLRSVINRVDTLNQDIWLEGLGFDIGQLQELLTGQRYVDGVLSGEVIYSKEDTDLRAYVRAQIDELMYRGVASEKVELVLDIGKGRLVADGGIWLNGEKKIVGDLDIPFTLSAPEDIEDTFYDAGITGSLFVNSVDMAFMRSLLDSAGYSNTTGVIDLNATLNGTADSPNITGKLDLLTPTISGIPLDSLFMDFDYQHEQEHVISNVVIIARGQRAVDARATVPFSFSLPAFDISTPGETNPLDIIVNTNNFNLAVFNDFLNKKYVRNLRGYLDASLKLEGTIGDLTPSGTVTLKEGDLGVPIAGIRLRNIRSGMTIDNSGLQINEFTMSSNNGGFAASGKVDLDGIEPTTLDLKMRASQFTLANTRDQNLTADLNGSLSGTFKQPIAKGQISIRNGFIFLNNFGEKNLETIVLENEEVSSFSPYDSLAMEMKLLIGDNFYIRNSQYLDMEIEMGGELELQKDHGEDLQVFGPLSAREGYVRPLGKRFDLTEGEFVFSGPVDDPQISVKTRYVPPAPEVNEIRYIITGTAQSPEFNFESEPFMEQQDIICYTFFGKPCNALDSWQQLFSGEGNSSAAMNLFAEVLLDEIEALATQELGIDVVQIDNTRSGSETGTSIKTGWYLNRRTFFAVINEISNVKPQILFLLEYMINQRLDLIITQGDRLREGIDLRWRFDY